MRVFPTLYKKTSTGAINEWEITVQDHNDGTATIFILQGQTGGKKQEYQEHITEGKNLGRSNATTPLLQAVMEAEAKWIHQQERRQYGTDPTGKESAEKRAASPMLAQKYQDHFKKVDWQKAYMQPKLDGNRCLARRDSNGVISLWTRKGVEIITLPHIQEALRPVMRNGETFDGEVYIHGTSVTSLRSFLTREQSGCELVQLRLYDIVAPIPFDDRISLLAKRLDRGDENTLELVETIKVINENDLMKFQAACIESGYEGAMLRWGSFPYESGKRSKGLLKVKTFEDAEFQVVDVLQGTSTFQDCAILVCRTQAGNVFTVTSPGTLEQKRQILIDKAQVIGNQVTVKFSGWTTTEHPVPFHPVAKLILE